MHEVFHYNSYYPQQNVMFVVVGISAACLWILSLHLLVLLIAVALHLPVSMCFHMHVCIMCLFQSCFYVYPQTVSEIGHRMDTNI